MSKFLPEVFLLLICQCLPSQILKGHLTGVGKAKNLCMYRALIEPRKAGAARERKQQEKNYLTQGSQGSQGKNIKLT